MTRTKKRTHSKSDQAEASDEPSSEPPNAAEEEFVSLATLKQMLSVQESMLKAVFDSVVSSLNARVDELVKTVATTKTSLEYMQKDIDDLRPLRSQLENAEQEIGRVQTALGLQGNNMEYLENQSRRNNIRVSGIPEAVGETWEMAETKVKEAIKEKLDMEVDIERAHRVNRRKTGNRRQGDSEKPRTIVCRLRDWKQKESVLRKARKEKPQDLFICEDLALATLQKRSVQVDKLKEAKRAGKTAYFILDRLIIRDKPPGQPSEMR